jgi:hypothetical protein
MTKDDYISRALGAVTFRPDPPQTLDLEAARRCAGDCFDKGFTLIDAIRFLQNLEHVDETVPEELALKRMSAIAEKYR